VITAAGLAEALSPTFVELVQPGAERPVLGVEVVEAERPAHVERGDVVLLVGARTADEVLAAVDALGEAAGVVLRRGWSDDPAVRRRCADAGTALLSVADETPWSSVLAVLRSVLETAHAGADQVYGDLFDMADKIGALIDAPITIEDATSRVLAYSTGQEGVDEARRSTIVGRRVPREVRDHFRSRGVFRRLARSDEPIFVPADADARARYVVPVRAGGAWLGSIWAVVDEPPAPEQARRLQAAAEVVALSLLRLRVQSELHRQVQLDEVRTVLRGAATERPAWLEPGPARVAVLLGPAGLGAQARCELWLTLARRHGWRQPVLAELDGVVHAVLSASTGPGGWPWLAELVREEALRSPSVAMRLGSAVDDVGGLARSCAEAAELAETDLGERADAVVAVDDAWAALVLHRAVAGLAGAPLVSPVSALLGAAPDETLVATLEAVIDYWGEGRRAARALGVHPNTVRYRMARLAELCPVDLDDPAQRLAVRLELARFRAGLSAAGRPPEGPPDARR